MRYVVIFILAICIHGAEWNDPALPMADSSKQIYQLDWGWFPPGNMWICGGWSAKRIPSADDMKKQLQYEYDKRLMDENIKQVKRADNLMLFGLLAIIACAIAHGCSSLPMVNRLSEYGIVGGVVSILGGIGYKFLIKNEVALEWLFITVVLCFGIYKILSHEKIRNWSVSHLFNRKHTNDQQG